METINYFLIASASATIVLAIAAFRSIRVSKENQTKAIEENRRIRDEDRQRDFQRRALDQTIDWAQWALALTYQYPTAPQGHILNIYGSLQTIRAKQNALVKTADSFSKELGTKIYQLEPYLDKFYTCVENSLKVGQGQKWEMPADIQAALVMLIEYASNLRATLAL